MKKNLKNLKFEILKRYVNGMKVGTITKNLKCSYEEVKDVIYKYEKDEYIEGAIKEYSKNYNRKINQASKRQPGRSDWLTQTINSFKNKN
jgi:transposase